MLQYEVVNATHAHAAYIAEHMRQADRDEIWASGHHLPLDALVRSMRVSRDTFTALANGVPFAIFGVTPLSTLSDQGVPWMLGTDELPKHARPFLRGSINFVRVMLQRYRVLTNFVDARNTEAVKWLRWLGFTIDVAKPHGLDGLPFHKFTMVGGSYL